MLRDLLIERGCKNMLARHVQQLAEFLRTGLRAGLKKRGVPHGEVKCVATLSRFAAVAAFAVSFAAAAEVRLPVAEFVRSPEIDKVQLSPTGEFVSALVTKDDQTSLVIYKTLTREFVNGLRLEVRNTILNYAWAGPAELVASLGIHGGEQGELVATGEVRRLMAKSGAKSQSLLNSRTVRDGFAWLVDATPENADTVLIQELIYGREDIPNFANLTEMNPVTGRRRDIAVAPEAYCSYVTDRQGGLRFATCAEPDEAQTIRHYRYAGGETAWQLMPSYGAKSLEPLFVTRDNRWVYFSVEGLAGSPGDSDCLARQPLDGSAPLAIVSCQAGHDLVDVLTSADGNVALAAYYEPDLPQLDFLENIHPDGELLLAFQQTFNGQLALPVSSSLDGKLWLFAVGSDRRPIAYYLYNRLTKDANKIFEQSPALAKTPLQPVQALNITGRDGRSLHGYLTLPEAKPGSKPPLVVLVHGGPFGVRDHWRFDPETQLLASRGYAVLRVNFRGSGGYGRGFRDAGIKQWGGLMIDDITDATRHVIAKGVVDARRVAIYGSSYGGSAALMSAVREPLLYKAVVSFAGVSDLALWKRDTDVSGNRFGKNYIKKYLGENSAELRRQSPIEYLDQLKAPVFIAHGEADQRVPFNQATRLRSALEKKQHPHEWLSKYGEGHGYALHANRVEFYEKMLAFLEKHLGAP